MRAHRLSGNEFMMMNNKSYDVSKGTRSLPWFLAAILTLLIWGETVQASADCPGIGFNNGYIDYDNRSMAVTRGEGVSCCLHHLQVLVVYEGLEPAPNHR